MFKQIFSFEKKVLIPYLTAGVPSLDETFSLACAMIESGAGVLELGVPFSDPSADGAVLQAAAHEALKNKINLVQVLGLAERIHKCHPKVPIVIFTYLNPLLAIGLGKYVKLATLSGVAATLTVDLPLEEAGEYLKLHAASGLKTVFLATPTTSPERLIQIAKASTGFLYYVSRNGVTGEQQEISNTLGDEVGAIRKKTELPLAIGFGISTPTQVRAVAQYADAVVIGSAYMRMILETPNADEREQKVRSFTLNCVHALES